LQLHPGPSRSTISISTRCYRATLKIAGRDFACKAVAYFHSQQGRADFTVVLGDAVDASHIVSFSGENARREQTISTNCRSTGCC
jgi:hypothetical protein